MKPGRRAGLRLVLGGCLAVLPQAARAGDEIRASADVTATGGWSSNPFTEAGKDAGSAYVQVDVRPVISLVAEHSIISLSGLFDYQHYFRDYSDSNDYGGGLDYSGTLTSRLKTHAAVRHDSSIVGGFDSFTPVTNPNLPQPPIITGPDIALVGTRDRRNTLTLANDTQYTLSAYDSLTANVYFSRVTYGGGGAASSYDSYGGGLGYSRRVSARLQLGLQGSASRTTYHGLPDNSRVYSVQATFSDQLSDVWSVQGAAGLSFSDQSGSGERTNFTGNLQLCHRGPRSSLCLTASDAVLPTGGTGTVDSKSVSGTYTYKLSERSSVSLDGEYSHNGDAQFTHGVKQPTLADSYLSFSGSYDRQLRQRVHLIASTHYRKLIGGELGGSRSDYGGSLGILIRFGDLR